ncbi:MAG: cobalt-precorrin-6A reductase [Alphaproteobacteria bacterium]|nr:cobalt-precorrin-6A reductase [Alphaproteobacteria bacterium]MDP6816456.1 cobalt-precorrin-6A reductase [Alphaproteobacteria bacterium]
MPGRRPVLLILGGTGDAVQLSHAAEQRFGERLGVIYSLAGRTRAAAEAGGELRVGGFGGVDGLARYIRDNNIDFLIDASHPFSAQISQHACLAAAATATPRCLLTRPAWQARQGDVWHEAADMSQAAALIPALGSRIFLSLGQRSLKYFSGLPDIWFLVRLIEAPKGPLPLAEAELITGRGPFDAASERRLFEKHRIDAIVTRASGGAATQGKIDAARTLGLPVIMLRRPAPPPGETADSIEAALLWLARGLDP